MKFQGYIDQLPVGRPFEADNEQTALAEMDQLWDGLEVNGVHILATGEQLSVKAVA